MLNIRVGLTLRIQIGVNTAGLPPTKQNQWEGFHLFPPLFLKPQLRFLPDLDRPSRFLNGLQRA